MTVKPHTQLGILIRRFRLEAGLSQDRLAERAGLSTRAVSDLERGVRSGARPETLRMLADSLELDADGLAALIAASRPELLSTAGPGATGPAPEGAPPLASLPILAGRVFGRNGEITTLVSQITEGNTRLITLTGPGGVGKTRLALEVAHRTAASFPDGIAFVDLAPIRQPELVASTIGQTFGIRESENRSVREKLMATLGSGRHCLLIDNFEQVIEAAPLVSELVSDVPGLTIVTTSREALRVRGESEMVIAPLEVPVNGVTRDLDALSANPAVALFVETARQVKPDFTLTLQNAAIVSEICRRLDGLPLAIELAATRVRRFPPHILLKHLEKSLPLLTGGQRDLPVRQQTLRDTIAWSYELLHSNEQVLFRRLGVFVGGATLEGMEATIAEGEPLEIDLLAGVSSLVDKSLMRSTQDLEGNLRFSMLQTIREFAVEQLEAIGERPATQRAHANWCLSMTRPVVAWEAGPEELEAMRQIAADHDNVRAALAWAIAEDEAETALRLAVSAENYWYQHGHIREGRRWLEAALALPGNVSGELRALALLAVGRLAHYHGDKERAEAALRQSLEHFRQHSNPPAEGMAKLLLGIAAEDSGEYRTAGALFSEARETFEKAGLAPIAGVAIYHSGVAAYGLGDLETATNCCEEAVRIGRELSAPFHIAAPLEYIALASCARGDLGRAAGALEEALSLNQSNSYQEGIARSLADLSVLAVAVDNLAVAVRLRGAAEAIRERIGLLPFPLPERLDYDRALEAARHRLLDTAFDQAWTVGWESSFEERLPEIETVLTTVRMAT